MLRFADRALFALLFQLPPRNTRLPVVAGLLIACVGRLRRRSTANSFLPTAEHGADRAQPLRGEPQLPALERPGALGETQPRPQTNDGFVRCLQIESPADRKGESERYRLEHDGPLLGLAVADVDEDGCYENYEHVSREPYELLEWLAEKNRRPIYFRKISVTSESRKDDERGLS